MDNIDIPRYLNSPESEFKIYDSPADLPLTGQPTRLNEGIVGICVGGSAVFDVFSNKHTVVRNELVVILPSSIASIVKSSDDFSMIFFKVPYDLFYETVSGISNITPDFFFYMQKHYAFPLHDEEEVERFFHFCYLIRFRANKPVQFFRKESLAVVLRLFYFDLFVAYKTDPEVARSHMRKYSHKEKIVYDFLQLLAEFFRTQKEVGFYAEKLSISPKYLTMIVKELTDKSAKDWINEYTLLEIKSLLRNSDLDIKEIIYKSGFSNHSSMSKFFRKHTGMSPTCYRDKALLLI